MKCLDVNLRKRKKKNYCDEYMRAIDSITFGEASAFEIKEIYAAQGEFCVIFITVFVLFFAFPTNSFRRNRGISADISNHAQNE